jgi:hypothetical protein
VAITGVHMVMHSSQPEQLRSMLRDVFGWTHVDAADGWLIFALPPAELGVHPSEDPHHELSLMCDDVEASVAELRAKGITFRGDIVDRGFGRAVTMLLPGGLDVLLYQPRHPTAI